MTKIKLANFVDVLRDFKIVSVIDKNGEEIITGYYSDGGMNLYGYGDAEILEISITKDKEIIITI